MKFANQVVSATPGPEAPALASSAACMNRPKARSEGSARRIRPKALPEGSPRTLRPKAPPEGSTRRLRPIGWLEACFPKNYKSNGLRHV
eukprot:5469330-Alexandrium_andersonii.AAC.1